MLAHTLSPFHQVEMDLRACCLPVQAVFPKSRIHP
jgi:hypothetical protein